MNYLSRYAFPAVLAMLAGITGVAQTATAPGALNEVLSTSAAGGYSTGKGPADYSGIGASYSAQRNSFDSGVIGDNAWYSMLQYDFNTPTPIFAYTFGSGMAENKIKAPRAWELLASDDGENWVTLDMRSNVAQLEEGDYVMMYKPGKSDRGTDFGKVADELLDMIDQRFYADWGNGKYLMHAWSANPDKINRGYNYWWMAHAVDAYIDAYSRVEDTDRGRKIIYRNHAEDIRKGMYTAYDANRQDLWNNYNDDMEWMCMACIRAYKALPSGNEEWLADARQLFDWIWESWDETTGGLLWKTDSERGVLSSKNSCGNAPAMICANLLYEITGDEAYLEKSRMIFDFMLENNLFDDGFVKDAPGNDNRGWTFTYNQGTWAGGLLGLYKATGDRKYYDTAIELMDKSMDSRWYSPHGIMGESGKGDGGLFKGIYIRNITDWVLSGLLDEEHATRYTLYLLENARSLAENAIVRPDMTVMANWLDQSEAGLETYDSSVLLSGLFLLESIDKLRRAGILDENYAFTGERMNKPYTHYRLKVTDNYGSRTTEFNSFSLLSDKPSDVALLTADSDEDIYYTIEGMPQRGTPSTPGLYIKDRKKFLIR
ncbi:MAG: hypothetical protein K2M67_08420 [Muribaculaceae bacterium]|nr:hypothetical protein [Muribaculaceae bacterium]